MIKTVIKRNGAKEPFVAEKLNGWGEWGAKTLGNGFDWASGVLHAVTTCPEECTSEQLQQSLIDYFVNLNTWEGSRMGGRLYAALVSKKIYGGKKPTVKELHTKMAGVGLMVKLNFTDEEYHQVEAEIIDHKRDLRYAHFQIHQIRTKYAIKNKHLGIEYETPQFVYMRMAMALAETSKPEQKMKDVKEWYDLFSFNKLNPPTPNFNNLGTKLNGYQSCCLYTVDDNIGSLAAGDHIAYMMTASSAGIGSHLKTRSLGDPIRGGSFLHQGKVPYYRAIQSMVGANLQNGRGGAATVHYTWNDPEAKSIVKLKNPMTPTGKQVRGIDYSFGVNKAFMRMVARDEKFSPFSYQGNEDLFESMYTPGEFDIKYSEFLKTTPGTESARQLLIDVVNESIATGRQYMHWTDQMNTHTPFKDKIYSSNLCLDGDSVIQIRDDKKQKTMDVTIAHFSEKMFNLGEWSVKTKSINGQESFEKVSNAKQTGKSIELIEIQTERGNIVRCTPDHQILTIHRGWVKAIDLQETDELVEM